MPWEGASGVMRHGQSSLLCFNEIGSARRLLSARLIEMNLITAGVYDKYSVDPSFRPICTRCCFTMIHMIQV